MSASSTSVKKRSLSDYGERRRMLGSGTFGEVYEYVDEHGKSVAVKIMKKKLIITDTYITTIQEIAYPLNLSHPNIINYIDHFISPTSLEGCVVMPMAESDLLRLVINGYFRDQSNMKDCIIQLLDGLAYLTSRNILHGDIKPGNVLVFPEEGGRKTYKFADFGLSQPKVCTNQQLPREIYTSWYRAPEIYLGKEYGEKADVWALGCVFYELTGYQAFPIRRESDGYNFIIDSLENMEFENVSQEFEDLIIWMLTPSRKHRPSVFQIIKHSAYLEGALKDREYVSKCERRFRDNGNFLQDMDLTPYRKHHINILISWLTEVGLDTKLKFDTIWLAKMSLLSYMSRNNVKTKRLQLAAVASLLNAISFMGRDTVPIRDYISITKNTITEAQLKKWAIKIAEGIDFLYLKSTHHDVLMSKMHSIPSKIADAELLLELASISIEQVLDPKLADNCYKAVTKDQSLNPNFRKKLKKLFIDKLEDDLYSPLQENRFIRKFLSKK